jgi:hypothetical protein
MHYGRQVLNRCFYVSLFKFIIFRHSFIADGAFHWNGVVGMVDGNSRNGRRDAFYTQFEVNGSETKNIMDMRKALIFKRFVYLFFIAGVTFAGCNTSGNKNAAKMNDQFKKGTYGYDVAFFQENDIKVIELKDEGSAASILIVPAYQGRVMTSSSEGEEGRSFGWINYQLIESGEQNSQFNPYGGEERIWLGPEGGPFSIYFKPGDEQSFSNWVVPPVIDTEPFDVVSQAPDRVTFKKDFELLNASGTSMQCGIERTVAILDRANAEQALGLTLSGSLNLVSYESENILINRGESPWNSETGVLSIWMLSMFNPSEQGVVFIPYREGDEQELGKIVNDDYFGKVPAERLLKRDGIIFFKTDGKYRSKIGLSPARSLPFCGSYDPENRTLTILWYSTAADPSAKYVNSKWGDQEDPLDGDVLNSYNDGPLEDGSIMGPFYEIESSSPAAFLGAGEKISHTQRIFHINGDEEELSKITGELFSLTIDEIVKAFE